MGVLELCASLTTERLAIVDEAVVVAQASKDERIDRSRRGPAKQAT